MLFTHFPWRPTVKMGGGGDTLTSATCLLRPHPASAITLFCANIATLWLLQPLLIYLSIFWGAGGVGGVQQSESVRHPEFGRIWCRYLPPFQVYIFFNVTMRNIWHGRADGGGAVQVRASSHARRGMLLFFLFLRSVRHLSERRNASFLLLSPVPRHKTVR